MAAVELGIVFRIFLVSCASIGKVFIVAGGGFYLTKRGIITQASTVLPTECAKRGPKYAHSAYPLYCHSHTALRPADCAAS